VPPLLVKVVARVALRLHRETRGTAGTVKLKTCHCPRVLPRRRIPMRRLLLHRLGGRGEGVLQELPKWRPCLRLAWTRRTRPTKSQRPPTPRLIMMSEAWLAGIPSIRMASYVVLPLLTHLLISRSHSTAQASWAGSGHNQGLFQAWLPVWCDPAWGEDSTILCMLRSHAQPAAGMDERAGKEQP
jgi:hypothetical protein